MALVCTSKLFKAVGTVKMYTHLKTRNLSILKAFNTYKEKNI